MSRVKIPRFERVEKERDLRCHSSGEALFDELFFSRIAQPQTTCNAPYHAASD